MGEFDKGDAQFWGEDEFFRGPLRGGNYPGGLRWLQFLHLGPYTSLMVGLQYQKG